MTRRDHAGKKSFNQRSGGVMKKANELRRKTGVKIAVFIQDGEDWSSYRSQLGFPPSTEHIGGAVKLPADFTTQREAEEERCENAELLLLPSSRGPPSHVSMPQQSMPQLEAFAPQSLTQPTNVTLDMAEPQVMSFDDAFFETISNDFEQVFAFPPKALVPVVKSEGNESFGGLQNAPKYEKNTKSIGAVPCQLTNSRISSPALMATLRK